MKASYSALLMVNFLALQSELQIESRPPSDSNEDNPINFADPPILIVDPLLSNSAFPPMPVSDYLPDTILNPPSMLEPPPLFPGSAYHGNVGGRRPTVLLPRSF